MKTGALMMAIGAALAVAAPVWAEDAKKAAAPEAAPDAVGQKAAALREAAASLEKAKAALDKGQRSFAEQLFSTAEIYVGADALADVAPLFRAGAPPRVTTPTVKLAPNTPPQPKVAGSSDDEPAAKIEKASLDGSIQVDGKPPAGSYGVITLEPASGKWKPRSAKQLIMEQRLREFAPRVMAISVGSTVTFPNFDSIFHNVFSTSEPAAFDLGLYKSGEARSFRFDKEGVVRVGCNLHANMAAWIVVVRAPHYAISDDSGKFAFKSLKPGKYTLKAWNEKSSAPVEQEITIKPGKNEISVGVKGDAPAGPMADKFGVARGKR